MSPFTKETAAHFGSQGGKLGGVIRAMSLSKAKRSKIAKLGGLARQAKARKAKRPTPPTKES